MQALDAGQKLEREALHKAELAVARNTQIYANSQRTKPPYANVLDFCFFTPPDAVRIPSSACDAFAELVAVDLMPAWAIALAPVDELRRGEKGQIVRKPRLLMCRGVALLAPHIMKDSLFVGLALLDDELVKPGDVVEVYDLDSPASYAIAVPDPMNAVESECYFELVSADKIL